MRLSLLRASKAPDDTADMGGHRVRWGILPHGGALSAATVRAGWGFNNPMRLLEKGKGKGEGLLELEHFPVVLRGDGNLVLDAVKRGEDDEGVSWGSLNLPTRKGRSVILRIYDALGGRGRGVVETSWAVKRVCRVNLLEDDGEDVKCEEGRFEVDLGAFEVGSWRIEVED